VLDPSLNFKLELVMLGALTVGAVLARLKHYRAHGFVQGTVVLLNLVLIATVMLPSPLLRPPDLVTTIHAALGGIMELLGIYVILVAATSLLPKAMRFTNYKPWMRTVFVGWWLVVGLGVLVYAPWGSPKLAAQDKADKGKAAEGVTIKFSNFKFEPKEITVKPGTTVTWVNDGGKHTINADTDEFKSQDITAGGTFQHKFTKPGDYPFYCKYHGDKGGVRMSGVVHVKP
jgi:plastocyanin